MMSFQDAGKPTHSGRPAANIPGLAFRPTLLARAVEVIE